MTCLGPSSTIDAHSEHCKGREEETYSNTIHEQRQEEGTLGDGLPWTVFMSRKAMIWILELAKCDPNCPDPGPCSTEQWRWGIAISFQTND